ncbi:MAG: hypothetical protein B6I31_04730 [Desulfobacteraceae bacterium 4572_19]|nr:MAG: hypothetical protein B6I31_04730 [Desulfobacteraceae bacterium 4572_19]
MDNAAKEVVLEKANTIRLVEEKEQEKEKALEEKEKEMEKALEEQRKALEEKYSKLLKAK